MLIKGVVRSKGIEEKFNFYGNYALETMLFQFAEKYYGRNVAIQIQDLLKARINKEG